MPRQKSTIGLVQPSDASHPNYEYTLAIGLTALVTIASLVIEGIAGHAAVSSLYLLSVVVAGLKLNRGPVLVVAASSALAWYTVFIPPRFAFHIGTIEDAIIFVAFFAVAMAMGHLTSKLRLKEIAERRREQRTATLYELVQQAGLAPDLDSGLRAAIRLIEKLFGVRASLLLRCADQSLATETHPASSCLLDASEYDAAVWAFEQRRPAGRFTESLPDARALHLPLQGRTAVMGILSIHVPLNTIFDRAERELLDAFAMLMGTVLEKDALLQGAKRAEIIEAAERLQRALLQSVSHELKTPLAAVQAGMEALRREAGADSRSQSALAESQQALRRLHRVINNLLDMTRIEAGVIRAHLDWCDISELVQASADLAADAIVGHPLALDIQAELPLVRIDQRLLEQCLSNLLLNAAANSALDAVITVRARVEANLLLLAVLDEGKGIADADLPRVFAAFQRGADAVPGGTGLGLAIVDGFVQAHGGNVTGVNRKPHGAEFVIEIPVETLHPEFLEKVG